MDAARPTTTDHEVPSPELWPLVNQVRPYAWGSRSHIPRFLGHPEDGEPAAELWLGAHAGDPSRLPEGDTLLDRIVADPEATLGADVHARFGARLPFLMKVLAAAEPLSLQVHPSPERAVVGYERENQAGIPLEAGHRNYRDCSHKPELIFALTRFEGMAGFRAVEDTARLLRLLGHEWADETAHRLGEGTPAAALRRVVTDILRAGAGDPDGTARLLAELGERAHDTEERLHRQDSYSRARSHRPDPVLREATRVFAQLPDLVERYPADAGALVTLLLNHIVLAPGESMFVRAGLIHAYSRGLGVEIMASSDNVLRAGLTPKHMDVEELLDVTDFTPSPAPYWNRVDLGDPDYARLTPPVEEFALHVATSPVFELPPQGPRIVLALEGEVDVVCGGSRRTLPRGHSVFVPHSAGRIVVIGEGRVAVASVPD